MSNKKKLLIVDDEEDITNSILKRIITQYDDLYEVLISVDGFEALDLVKSNDIDLIVLDIRMKNLHGGDVCRELKSDPKYKDIPIIISSGHLDDTYEEELTKVGVEGFLRKPYQMDTLFEKISKLLDIS